MRIWWDYSSSDVIQDVVAKGEQSTYLSIINESDAKQLQMLHFTLTLQPKGRMSSDKNCGNTSAELQASFERVSL